MVTPHWAREFFVNFLIRREERSLRKYKKEEEKEQRKGKIKLKKKIVVSCLPLFQGSSHRGKDGLHA